MKSQDAPRLSVLRMMSSALNNRRIEKRAKVGSDVELTDEEVLEIVSREAKKRKESIVSFMSGGRPDLAAQEQAELDMIVAYLPAQLDEAAVRTMLQRILLTTSERNFGALMKLVTPEFKGKADMALVGRIVKELLA